MKWDLAKPSSASLSSGNRKATSDNENDKVDSFPVLLFDEWITSDRLVSIDCWSWSIVKTWIEMRFCRDYWDSWRYSTNSDKFFFDYSIIRTLLHQGPFNGRPTIQRVLVISPSSLTQNWHKEFRRWLGRERINVFIVDQVLLDSEIL